MSNLLNIGITEELFSDVRPEPYPAIDLSELTDNPKIKITKLPDYNGQPFDAQAVAGLDALVTANAAVSRESLLPEAKLTLISRIASGYDDIDLDAMTTAGVAYSRAGGHYSKTVSLAAYTLMLSVLLRLGEKMQLCRAGDEAWFKGSRMAGFDPRPRTFGLVGLGAIGQEILRLAAPLGMTRLVHTRTRKEGLDNSMDFRYASLEDLLKQADVVVLACALTDETRNLLSEERLALLKKGACVVNVGRGELIDERALISALDSGELGGAGLDVTVHEPVSEGSALFDHPKVIVTPHSLGVTDYSHQLAGAEALAAIQDLMSGKPIRNLANNSVLKEPAFLKKCSDIKEVVSGLKI